MKNIAIIISLIALALFVGLFTSNKTAEAPTDVPLTAFEDTGVGLTFSYPSNYVAQKDPGSTDPDFERGYIFMLNSDYTELANSMEPREGPPTINVRVYRNPQKQWATLWPENHPQESNIGIAIDTPQDTVVGGANAVTYTIDGLYRATVYVVASGSYIYVFSGSYQKESDIYYTDFKNIMDSVTFVPESQSL